MRVKALRELLDGLSPEQEVLVGMYYGDSERPLLYEVVSSGRSKNPIETGVMLIGEDVRIEDPEDEG